MRSVTFRLWPVGIMAVAIACARPRSAAPGPDDLAAVAVLARAGCCNCHAPGDDPGPLAPRARLPLGTAPTWLAADAVPRCWPGHAGLPAAELLGYVDSLAAAAEPAAADISPATVARGERLVDEFACRACHAPKALDLAARTELAALTRFLVEPGTRRPDVAHPALPAEAARAVAAFLLRAGLIAAPPQPGFAWACHEIQVDDEELPDLHGRSPAARGVAARIDATVATRPHHFALEFRATLDVPVAGEWQFTVGSDDGAWLWIDDRLVVANPGLAPHRRRSGTVQLAAGSCDLRVVHTQAEGQASLEVLWRGPGHSEQPLPAERATAVRHQIVPPPRRPAADPAAVARGRIAARARHCAACHTFADPAFAALPPPAPPPPLARLGAGACPDRPAAATLWAAASAALRGGLRPADELEVCLARDGCGSCHARGGRGGLPPVVRRQLADTADLGDEGRLPPDLTAVGRRLRPGWIEQVVGSGRSVRPYLRLPMPAYGAEIGAAYARLFAATDAPGVVDVEPAFDKDQVEQGRLLAGATGRGCVTCHPFDSLPALGPQGMDLAIQSERLRPGWLRDWLLRPTELRPGTRMPPLFARGDAADRAAVEALLAWSALGRAAPVPRGLGGGADSYELIPEARPILHGAFLRGLSARCLAVGTPERIHYAYDLAAVRLAWLWRGAFLDARGTWHGRAGKLLEPLGRPWVVLEDFAVGAEAPRRLLGQRRTPDGRPVLRVAVGDAEYEDEAEPRPGVAGGELVRTLRVVRGTLTFVFPPGDHACSATVGGQPAARHVLAAGAALEVVYRW